MDISQVAGSSFVAQSVSDVSQTRPQSQVDAKQSSVDTTKQTAVPKDQTAVAAPEQPSQKELQRAIDRINNTIKAFNPSLDFSIDSITKQIVVQVTDKDTKEVVRQIPSEEVLHIARTLDVLQGLLIKQIA